jgi:hypothetical protein
MTRATETDKNQMLRPFPRIVVDLWPDSSSSSALQLRTDLLDISNCVPHRPDECRVVVSHNSSRIAIVRSPGRLSAVLESYVRSFVQAVAPTNDTNAQPRLTVMNRRPDLWTFPDNQQHPPFSSVSAIIRPIVLPPLLEALDLILQTRDYDDNDQQQNVPTVDELVAVLHQLMQWHCRVSSALLVPSSSSLIDGAATRRTTTPPILTLTLDEVMAYPRIAQETLMDFLFGKDPQVADSIAELLLVDMDPLAQAVLRLVEQATVLLEQIRLTAVAATSRTTAAKTIMDDKDWDNRVIQRELEWFQLLLKQQADELPLSNVIVPKTRMTDLVGAFLLAGPDQQAMACQTYPKAILCQEEPTNFSYGYHLVRNQL